MLNYLLFYHYKSILIPSFVLYILFSSFMHHKKIKKTMAMTMLLFQGELNAWQYEEILTWKLERVCNTNVQTGFGWLLLTDVQVGISLLKPEPIAHPLSKALWFLILPTASYSMSPKWCWRCLQKWQCCSSPPDSSFEGGWLLIRNQCPQLIVGIPSLSPKHHSVPLKGISLICEGHVAMKHEIGMNIFKDKTIFFKQNKLSAGKVWMGQM